MVFKNILVPLDGSALAERAIPHALAVARPLGSNIVLLRVLEPDTQSAAPPDPLAWQIQRADAELHLREVEDRVRAGLGEASATSGGEQPAPAVAEQTAPAAETSTDAVGVQTAVAPEPGVAGAEPLGSGPDRVRRLLLEGKTAETIVEVCTSEKIDLLVLSTHGSSGLSRWTVNSVAHKVLESAYLPVLIVRSYKAPEDAAGELHYRRIVVPLDGSRRAEGALAPAVALAQADQADLLLLSVLHPPELPDAVPLTGDLKDLTDRLLVEMRQAYYTYLEGITERIPVPVQCHVLEEESVIDALQDLCIEQGADLVVLCAHGHASRGTHPYGAVARYAIQDGTLPLLIMQDIPRTQSLPTEAERAAESTRSR